MFQSTLTSADPESPMTRYAPTLVVLHWLLALMIIAALLFGSQLLDPMPNSDLDKVVALRSHMLVGFVIVALMGVRLAVRRGSAHPPVADAGHPMLTKAGVWAHWALYGLVFAMALSGLGLSLAAGLPDVIFGTSQAGLPESFDVFAARRVHGVLATLLGLLIALHVAAVAYHMAVRRDGLIRRMWFGKDA